MQLSGRARVLSVGGLVCAILYIYLYFQYPSLSVRRLWSAEPQEQAQQELQPGQKQEQEPQQPFEPLSKDDFVSAAVRNALAVYDAAPIERFCAHDSWNTNIVVNCDRIFGGIGNLRQVILACLHYAMKEGYGFIVPALELRKSDDLILLESNGETGFEYAFDRDLFVSRLSAACPRMTVYNSLNAAMEKGHEINHFGTTMAKFVVCQDPSDFATNLGNLLLFPPDIYRLAYSALHALGSIHALPISPSPLSSSSTYLGIHLRTAIDAVAMGWSSYKVQADRYLYLAATLSFPVIYVASGNATSVSLFAAAASELSPPRAVVSKDDLLSGSDLAEMEGLTWDQLALIDYVLLESAGFFAGVTESSFSWNIAAKRLAVAGGRAGFCAARKSVPAELVWKDQWSLIYGDDSTAFGGKIWP